MTAKIIDGFETCRQDADVRLRGVLYSNACLSASVPSATGVSGYALAQLSPAVSVASLPPIVNGGVGTTAVLNTGMTVNQIWAAGGFSFGISATQNLSLLTGGVYGYSFGPATTINANTVCFDGTRYWAMGVSGTTYNVFTSTNLTTWTPTASQPGALSSLGQLSYMGGGVVALISISAAATTGYVYYTNNQGASWTSQAVATWTGSTGQLMGNGIATNNSAYPHVLALGATSGTVTSTSGPSSIVVGTLGGTMTPVIFNGAYTSNPGMRPVTINGLIFVGNASLGYYSATASNSNLNTAAAWTAWAPSIASSILGITYNPISNLYVIATTAGISTFLNTGAAGTPVSPSGTQVVTSRYTTAGMNSVYWTGTQLVAFGTLGHIITSPDGITWTEIGARALPVGVAGSSYLASLYDGTQYVLFTDTTSGLVITTPDGVNNHTVQYASHKAPSSAIGTDTRCIGPLVVTAAPTTNPVTTALTQTSTSVVIGVAPQAINTAGVSSAYIVEDSRPANALTNLANITSAVAANTPQSATHYYELVYTAAPTINTFNVSISIDGTVVYSTASAIQMAATADTTSVVLMRMLPASQCVAQVDDMYFNTIDGVGVSGALGQVTIVAMRPSADVQDNWVKNGAASSNALSVRQPSYSSQSANYISSANSGDKDIYSSADTVPSGYTPRAVQLEAVFTRTSTTAPTANVGIISGGVELDSSNVTMNSNSPTFASGMFQNNPNGNVAWTRATVNAAEFVVNHVS